MWSAYRRLKNLSNVNVPQLNILTATPRPKENKMSQFKYFKLEDFDCQETGENEMSIEFIERLDGLRSVCGFPFIVTSGYRSPNHSIEAKKEQPGQHAQGIAADIKVVGGAQRRLLVEKALEMGFTGVGVDKNFIHVDIRTTTPVLWVY